MANEKILVVDDDKNICELLRLYLVKEGYNVTMVHDGGAALAEFDKLHPDLVLLDVMMPVMDGLAATHAIRTLPRKDSAAVPIVAVSANAFDEDIKRSLASGMNAHLSKPIEVQKLRELLRQLTSNA